MYRTPIIIILTFMFTTTTLGGRAHGKVSLSLVEEITDPAHFSYTVMAKTYPGLDPDVVVVTARESGVSVWNTSVPTAPELLGAWNTSLKVEGQAWDAETGVLMVVDIGKSGVWTFRLEGEEESSNLVFEELGFVQVAPEGALHGRIYKPEAGGTYGVISVGYFVNVSSLVIVDLGSPSSPTVVGVLDMPDILNMEGVYIHSHYAMIGGFHNDVFQVVDLSDVSAPKIVDTLQKDYFLQMVSSAFPQGDILYTALWGNDGGLATFDMSDLPDLKEMDHIVQPDLGKANRVHLDPLRMVAFLPLQGHEVNQPGLNGGVAIVDISDPSDLGKDFVVRLPKTTMCYELALVGGGGGGFTHLYAFGTTTNTAYVYEIVDHAHDQ